MTVAETAAVRAFGPWMGASLSILIGVALLSSLSAFILIGPRVYYAMALDRLFFPFAAKVHPKHRVPGRSILIQGSLAVIMLIIGSYEQLLVYLGFSLSIFPWLAIAGIFIARRRGIGNDTAVKVWGYPIVPGFYLLASLGLMIVAYINRPLESTIAVATVLLGIPCYFLGIKNIRSDTQ
jgi:APA family basic amino acid/polyamine antiporter